MSERRNATGPRRILVLVEDDDSLARMLVTMLRDVAEVFHARDGQDALDRLAVNPCPSAILTDRAMPRVDGLELVRTLKRNARWRSVPVMMLTARGGSRGTIDAINAGVKHYLTKPFKSADLVTRVAKMLADAPQRTRESIDVSLEELVERVDPRDVRLLEVDLVELDPELVTPLSEPTAGAVSIGVC
jgi:DNA-binding response OmpR family regulator